MPKLYKHVTAGTEHIVCCATAKNCGAVADWLVDRGATFNGDELEQVQWLDHMRWVSERDYAVILGAEGKEATIREYSELAAEYDLIGEYNG